MKYLYLTFIYMVLFIICLTGSLYADETVELVGPGITWHVIDGGASSLYSHQISSDGRLIYTPQIGLRKTHIDKMGYESLTVFTAKNSIGSPIYGAFGGSGAEFFKLLSTGFVYGGYIQNNEDFKAKGITPYSLTGNTNAFVPILGIEINVKIRLQDQLFLGFNNLISPIITNHSLSLGWRY